ncbi:MAG: hypothetical protein A2798_00105 [Candidatus Levybacteria bacterium RIFCSPHIGHO2_01_FULL_37_17]|nr:MAG: hypothetical protein A2798_00105 [Candidatus Levybacteria bacterium RIFCSPHIGHO2_01_FULL_37_17]OGH36502.1 MAG: hypothetical protein A2959_03260 [Candidatus Levybacteria bacterium RIFCSPLOWO2_01_FULL_38_23]
MFAGRVDAAQKLLSKLKQFEQSTDTCVLGLLRGGIVTAKVISEFLLLPIQPLIVKKIGAPGNSELAIGAMVGRKNVYWNSDLVKKLRISKKQKNYLVDSKMAEIKILEKQLQIPEFKYFKNVILADDGVATGATVIASQEFLRKSKVNKIYLATPIIASDTLRDIKRYFDGLFYLEKPKDFYAVSEFYQNFPQVTNSEVSSILHS